MQVPVFVIAFVVALLVGRAWVVLAIGVAIAFASALLAALGARGDNGEWFDFSSADAFTLTFIVGFFLYAGWALGVAAATFVTRTLDR